MDNNFGQISLTFVQIFHMQISAKELSALLNAADSEGNPTMVASPSKIENSRTRRRLTFYGESEIREHAYTTKAFCSATAA
ncbi:hypothetical protein MASR1M65_31250 [Saprospiraceae bacterium]